jgi:amino acid adenylation domain-containing protein
MVIAILAIAKAGAAWLPIDPDYPTDRITHMIMDAAPILVLDRLPATSPFSPVAPEVSVSLTNAAYVIYTSGSTGRPKGVVVTHGGLSDLAASMVEQFDLAPSRRILQFASPSFDASIFEILMAAGSGAALVVPAAGLLAGDALAEVLIERKVTHAHIPPAVVATLPEFPERMLDCLVVGADACSPELVARWAGRSRMINAYGPTEITMAATFSNVLTATGEVPPIGAPIGNTRVFVLDPGLGLVPPGVVGELYIAGAGVARGYLNQPGLTATRFVADPFAPTPGARLYRTGDLVRWNNEGQLIFVGRVDDQVKVRGFRIELGEIKSVLLRDAVVDQAAVVVREDHRDDKRIIAYVVGAAGVVVDATAVRERVAAVLPEYMVPSVVVLDELPLTPNGKLDRRRLPAPEYSTAGGRGARTEREKVLCALFAETLGLDEVSIDDGFFDLGGHSLLATRLISRIHAVLDVEISLRALFQAPTVAALSQQMHLAPRDDALGPVLPLRSTGSRLPIFCVHPVGGTSWCYSGLLQHFGPDYPIYGIQARGLIEDCPLPQSIEEMACDYVEMILSVQNTGPFRLIGWSLGGTIAHAMTLEMQHRGYHVEFLALLDSIPYRDHKQEESSRQEGLLRGIAEAFGAETENLGRSPSLTQIVEATKNGTSPLSSLRPEQVQRVLDVALNSTRVSRLPRSVNRISGDLHFYSAVHDRDNFRREHAGLWAEYCSGQVYDYRIDCLHGEMMSPEPLSSIAKTLVANMQELDKSDLEDLVG